MEQALSEKLVDAVALDDFEPLPGSAPVPIVDNKAGCRWPLSEGGTVMDMATHYYDLERSPGSSYCPTHRAISTKPAQPRQLPGR
ncbi:hypothetical protein VQ042_12595 [Aurantimonas sp. A2-1-M11]|uniref:hypothetical protein n=1 Tax=Aurantimonas sp. A2-1-M11 TaxID=3113712 RepID=UPI002F9310D5